MQEGEGTAIFIACKRGKVQLYIYRVQEGEGTAIFIACKWGKVQLYILSARGGRYSYI